MDAFSYRYACSLPVTLQDGGNTIRSTKVENPMLHEHFTTLCVIDAVLLATEFLHCAEVDTHRHLLHVYLLWTVFSPVTFTLVPGPSCMNLTCIARRYMGCAI